jgi:DNA polymerase-3 subunit chi
VAKVDFYILRGTGELERQQFACRLAEKAYRLDNRVHIHAVNHESAQKLDDLLWTFRDGSFVPHEILGSSPGEPVSPVTIGCNEIPAGNCDLLINLSDTVPDAASSFPRVAEVVSSDEECKAQSRQRFVDYRDQGHTLDTHNL